MPQEFLNCVNKLMAEGKDKDSCYAICTAQFKKRHGGMTPQEAEKMTKQMSDAVDEIVQQVAKRKGVNPEEGESKYGDVTYADETNKKYPIDTEEHVRAAWSYINMPKNAAKYSPEDVKKIKGKIRAAGKKFNITFSDSAKQYLEIAVDSTQDVEKVEIKQLDTEKGVDVVLDGNRIIQYRFDLANEASGWTEEAALGYIQKRISREADNITQSLLPCEMHAEPVSQSYLSEERMTALKAADPEPYFGVLRVKYGVGSNKQSFDKEFFQTAGAKFEGKPFFLNHSDLQEFGKASPIGAVVKFLGAQDEGADFAFYVSAAEAGLRQKLKESVALGDLGFVKKVSIEGIPRKGDFTVGDDGIKHFKDLAYPTGIAIVNLEGLRGSQIIS